MTDRDLNDLLQKAQAPVRPDEYWQEFPGLVSRSLSRPARSAEALQHVRRLRLALRWCMAFALVCLAIGVVVGRNHWRVISQEQDLAEARKLVNEVMAMFPGQLQAIVMEKSRTQLVLADTPSVSQTLPVFLRVCDERGCERIITFSGQQVQLNGRTCDVLVDSKGNVILAGNGFVWSSETRGARAGRLRISAESLEGVL